MCHYLWSKWCLWDHKSQYEAPNITSKSKTQAKGKGIVNFYPLQWLQKLRDLQRDFLWSGVGEGKRDHLVSWDVVCKPKAKGCLGFGKIALRNVSLLGKWLWRYPKEGSALWHKVILSIYRSHSNGWDANTIVRWSHHCPWKAIAQVFQDFSKYTRFVVGDGERIRLWEDFWWGDQPTFGIPIFKTI